MADWQSVVCKIKDSDAEIIENLFRLTGAASVTLREPNAPNTATAQIFDQGDQDDPTAQLWPTLELVGLFPVDVELELLRSLLRSHGYGGLELHIETLADKDWHEDWLNNLTARQFGNNLWVCPSHIDPPPDARAAVILEPGMAFGTGTHPTTAMCLEWLSNEDLSGRRVLDFGCGSGILALAAAKLGAAAVTAIDNDAQAIEVCEKNIRLNHVSCVEASLPRELPSMGFDIVIANILMTPLIELASVLTQATGSDGIILLSGILADQAEPVIAAYYPDFDLQVCTDDGGWVLIAGRRA